jgi:hypothetical protein
MGSFIVALERHRGVRCFRPVEMCLVESGTGVTRTSIGDARGRALVAEERKGKERNRLRLRIEDERPLMGGKRLVTRSYELMGRC